MVSEYVKVEPRIYADDEFHGPEKAYITYKTKRPQIPTATRDDMYAVVRERCDDADQLSFVEGIEYLCDLVEKNR